MQEHLFENLYLLDPAWERATEDIHMEEDLRRVDPGILATDDEDNEIRGRLDIRYRKSAGSHVIIELKRSGRNLTVEELAMQGQKYFDGLTSILQDQRRGDEKVEVVFVLGSNPRVVHKHTFLDDSGYTGNAFMSFGGRFVLYEELIANARGQYRSYLEKSKEANQLEQLLSSLEEDTESPPE